MKTRAQVVVGGGDEIVEGLAALNGGEVKSVMAKVFNDGAVREKERDELAAMLGYARKGEKSG